MPCPKQPSSINCLLPEPGVKLTWRFVISVVPHQTGGLVHAQAIKSDSTPLQSTIKLFKWAGSIKTSGTIFFEEFELCKRMSKILPPIPGKVWHFMLSSVSGCRILIDVLLLGCFCQSINQLDVATCRMKCHQQIENSIQLNHFRVNN